MIRSRGELEQTHRLVRIPTEKRHDRVDSKFWANFPSSLKARPAAPKVGKETGHELPVAASGETLAELGVTPPDKKNPREGFSALLQISFRIAGRQTLLHPVKSGQTGSVICKSTT